MAYVRPDMEPTAWDRLRMAGPTLLTLLWLAAGLGLHLGATLLVLSFKADLAVPLVAFWAWTAVQAVLLVVMLALGRGDARLLLPATIVCAIMFYFGVERFRQASDQIAFSFARTEFDSVVAKAYAPRDRPVFIAFPWTPPDTKPAEPGAVDKDGRPIPTGRVIVYDETDAIDGVNSYTWRQLSPYLAETIDGRPHRCARFAEPHYYLCSFASFS